MKELGAAELFVELGAAELVEELGTAELMLVLEAPSSEAHLYLLLDLGVVDPMKELGTFRRSSCWSLC
jgi:hypothetical protein